MSKLTPRELAAVLASEGCDCTDGQRERRAACTRRIIRCKGRHAWKRDNDAVFRHVWAGWYGIPMSAKQKSLAEARRIAGRVK